MGKVNKSAGGGIIKVGRVEHRRAEGRVERSKKPRRKSEEQKE